jgi:phosphoribosylanthranilate isomerase
VVEVKFCGLTRAEDAAFAAALDAAYVGAIFAASPRHLDPIAARAVLDGAGTTGRPQRVGVFGDTSPDDIASSASEAGLNVAQLHADPDIDQIIAVRRKFGGEIWAAVRIASSEFPAESAPLFTEADAIVLDAKGGAQLGGTGRSFDWSAIARAIDSLRGQARIVLAGGLNPTNVAEAVRLLAPDVVDVSSGVETNPGIKDHARMRAFTEALGRRGP